MIGKKAHLNKYMKGYLVDILSHTYYFTEKSPERINENKESMQFPRHELDKLSLIELLLTYLYVL